MRPLGFLTLAALLCAALAVGASPSAARPARYRTRAVHLGVHPVHSRSRRGVAVLGRVFSPYRPCQANRTLRFYHRVRRRDVYLSRGLMGHPRRHHSLRRGVVLAALRVARPRRGAYFMTVAPKRLPNGAICLGAKSALRRAR